ncbi:dihydrofolate reductase [Dyadobacter fanqingshengii]|uniref:Dihydrofolate reductase n=1 Tax=Dyadobacter fanqingshengii TaxID=2906443 RepID=A0A9X1T823_9BACT|nr:dihydrofolate reductase [Dyadobacter fanqingshengii]MCF0039306.1 dihydrofolate reductase [Dyadobacter fanqingshengii]USJ33877.1 dihydrofolate reductase [Dyadobacter fanqingshengii]
MLISIIVAVSENGVIGKDNQLLWRLPDDLKRFKQLTLGHPMIMGRKTFESIGKPLPGRTSIVITSQKDFNVEGILVAHSLEEALHIARGIEQTEAFIIGGGEIYKQALPLADRLYVTEVETVMDGDTLFEITDRGAWTESERIVHEADERHKWKFAFVNYIKQKF